MHAPSTYDLAICGAGPVGMALAALLAQRGAASAGIVLVDAKSLEQARHDPRTIALSHGSRLILEEAGAWPVEATPIHQIHVSRRGRFGRSLMERSEHGVEALGYVARYGAVVSVLADVCERAGIASLRPARVTDTREDADGVDVTVERDGAGQTLRARLLVQAEGGLFGQQKERAVSRDYGQSAIIAHVRTSHPVPHRAYERFTDEGPLALLPEDDGYALVWCVPPARAAQLLALDEAAFLARLGAAFGERLGRFTHVSPRLAYPLGLNAEAPGTARTIAIGNAAQTLHPVAGQGLNLGLRDAAVLARVLAADSSPAALARYASQRAADRGATVRITDTMARIFTGNAPAQTLLGLSLGLLDIVRPARHVLAGMMMYGRR
ncbi:UbiH/UbiF/VisC/COQ6 family ubiquinone biosynthesis hydroxylase [Janthinobacterium aquaticum]|uniref:UbiH/UbiF/VisC/COQ6 family ubiquinone biosynthesis hydroxylase n=1 Tax=Janthinobacterium sp. FT58W TaxID=2654254 RepID=UPI001264BA57|nr:UbiH/UbiF/VisC/COQ6 family ubiquinone biosynthesis hydroxylase [Janthinobacterium sp. FT58W]KAB8043965.1 UbiH/UbiF/VisC/COQ6 family ubiquinone biosynthesis hydroxylase [Janthinobacterium sp. FT58W]